MTFVAPNLAWGEARGGSIPRKWGCDRTSNEAPGQIRRNPSGGGSFRPRRRCSLLTDPRTGYARRSRLAWAENSSPQTSPYLRPGPLIFIPPAHASTFSLSLSIFGFARSRGVQRCFVVAL